MLSVSESEKSSNVKSRDGKGSNMNQTPIEFTPLIRSKLRWPSRAASRTALLEELVVTKLTVPAVPVERAQRPRAKEEDTNSSAQIIQIPISINTR